MMAGELVDPVKATKLLVFMCLDCPSPWGHYTRSGGGGAQLAGLRAHADAGSPSTTKTNVTQLPPTLPSCRVFRMPRSSCGCPGSSDGGEQGEERERREENEEGVMYLGFGPGGGVVCKNEGTLEFSLLPLK